MFHSMHIFVFVFYYRTPQSPTVSSVYVALYRSKIA